MTNLPLYRRILRRETHSPRSVVAITIAVVLLLVLAWVATECILALFSLPALLVAPTDALTAVTGLPQTDAAAAIMAGGIATALIGLAMIVVSVAPGRRARHIGVVDRTAVVVDNGVIASALARTASHRANIDPDQVIVTVGHRTAEIAVRPSSGFHVDREVILEAVQQRLDEFDLRPALRARVVVETRGVVA